MNYKKTKSRFYSYFKIWWIPIVSYFLPFLIFLLGSILERDSIITIALMIFFANIIGNIISAIIQIIIKKWYYLIPQLLISGLLFFFVGFIFAFSPPDYYGAHKEIPENIEIYEPLKNEPTKKELETFDLILTASFQPGIYNYFTDYKPTELGVFYIKAFEITTNDKLSEKRIKTNSKIKVRDLSPKLYFGEFMIYEGSWGDKYGARIELWFKSLNGKNDYKIAERNYIVEGWMR